MAGVWVDTGKLVSLDQWRQYCNLVSYLALIDAPFTPARGLVWANLSEASFPGYVRARANAWPAPALDSTFHAFAVHPNLSFPNNGSTSVTIYGWAILVIVSAQPVLVTCGLFSPAEDLMPDGVLVASPLLQDTSEF